MRWGLPEGGVKVAFTVSFAVAPARLRARRPFLVALSVSVTVPALTLRVLAVATGLPRSCATARRRPAEGTVTLTVTAEHVVLTTVPGTGAGAGGVDDVQPGLVGDREAVAVRRPTRRRPRAGALRRRHVAVRRVVLGRRR